MWKQYHGSYLDLVYLLVPSFTSTPEVLACALGGRRRSMVVALFAKILRSGQVRTHGQQAPRAR